MFKWRLVRLLATEYASIDNEEKLPFIQKSNSCSVKWKLVPAVIFDVGQLLFCTSGLYYIFTFNSQKK